MAKKPKTTDRPLSPMDLPGDALSPDEVNQEPTVEPEPNPNADPPAAMEPEASETTDPSAESEDEIEEFNPFADPKASNVESTDPASVLGRTNKLDWDVQGQKPEDRPAVSQVGLPGWLARDVRR